MTKKVFILVVALCCVFVLAGCGANGNPGSTLGQSTEESSKQVCAEETYYNISDAGERERVESISYQYETPERRSVGAYYDSSGEWKWNYTYKYDEQGNMIEESNSKLTHSLAYDEYGNIVKESFTGDGVKGEIIYTYEYDSQHRPITGTSTDGEGNYVNRYEYFYNEQGKIERENRRSADNLTDEPDEITTYLYDGNENIIEKETYHPLVNNEYAEELGIEQVSRTVKVYSYKPFVEVKAN